MDKRDRTCQYCEKVFLKPAQLRRHMETASCQKQKKLATCHSCQKKFIKPAHLDRHLSAGSCQKPPKDFACSICHKSYTRKDRLIEHVRKFHPDKAPEKKSHNIKDVKDFTCCGQTFQSPREVWRHKQIHHYAKLRDGTGKSIFKSDSVEECDKNSLKCPYNNCNVKFLDRTEALNHRKEHNIESGNNLSKQIYNQTAENVSDDSESDNEPVDVDNGSNNETQKEASPATHDDDPVEILRSGAAKHLFIKIGATIVDRSGEKRFRTVRKRQSFRLTPAAKTLCENGLAMEVITMVIDKLLKKYKERGGRMQIKVLADSLDPPIVTPLFKTYLFSSLMLLNYIESVLSSKDKFVMDETLTIDVTHVADVEAEQFEVNE